MPTRDIQELRRRYWGYEAFLPQQVEAIDAVLAGRDAVVVRAMGIGAATLNSSLTADERRSVLASLRHGEVKLLYLSPERIAMPDVRRDIEDALRLRDPARIIGSFDRPNLLYRAVNRRDLDAQLDEVLERHAGEAGVVYCIRRADVDAVCARLVARGLVPEPTQRRDFSGVGSVVRDALCDQHPGPCDGSGRGGRVQRSDDRWLVADGPRVRVFGVHRPSPPRLVRVSSGGRAYCVRRGRANPGFRAQSVGRNDGL